MVGFSGRLVLEGFEELSEEDASLIIRQAYKHAENLHAWKTTLGVRSVTRAYSLGDGIVATVADLSNLRAIRISVPSTAEVSGVDVIAPVFGELQTTSVPDVLSGFVSGTGIRPEVVTLRYEDPDDPSVVEITGEYDLLIGFQSCTYSEPRYTDAERRYRLAIGNNPVFGPTTPLFGDTRYSQYTYCKPSLYSGSMKKVVQLLFGVGKMLEPRWAKKFEAALGLDPLEYSVNFDPETSDAEGVVESPSSYDTRDGTVVAVQLTYDYRFSKTHGIHFAADNKPWLLEASPSGLYAVPLYMDPVSQSEAGRERYLEVNPELSEFFNEFGGFPEFRPFPTGATLTQFVNAGEALQLLDSEEISDFYSNSAFSSDLGWTFNSRGSEAHNTCYGYADPGFSEAKHFRMDINVGPTLEPEPLSGARGQLTRYARYDFELRKCQRMSESDAEEALRIFGNNIEEGYAFFDAIEVDPMALGLATLTLVRGGIVYSPATFLGQPQIKFPESLAGGLLSFDFGPYNLEARDSPLGNDCDAPMHVAFVDDSLEIVNYYARNGDRGFRDPPQYFSTRADCQYEGRWEEYTPAGDPFLHGNFYSNSWDPREQMVPNETRTTFDGRKAVVFQRAAQPFWPCFSVWEYTYIRFAIDTFSAIQLGRGKRSAVAIPAGVRDCYAVAEETFADQVLTSEGMQVETLILGPQRIWRGYHFIMHWFPCQPTGPDGENDFGTGAPPGWDPCVFWKTHDYSPASNCGYTDDVGGFFYSVCPLYSGSISEQGGSSKPIHIGGTGFLGSTSWGDSDTLTPWSESSISEKQVQWRSYLFCSGQVGRRIILKAGEDSVPNEEQTNSALDDWWWRASPDVNGSVPFMGASQSCLGSLITNYHTDIDGLVTKHIGGPDNMHAGVLTAYVGVVQ